MVALLRRGPFSAAGASGKGFANPRIANVPLRMLYNTSLV